MKNVKEIIIYHVVQMAKALREGKPYTENTRLFIHCMAKAIVRMTEHGSEVHRNEIQELAKEIKNHMV